MSRSLLVVFLLALLGACSSVSSPAIRDLYRDAALREDRNPVVVIHGILGSRLVDEPSGKVVWGAFTKEGIDPNSAEGARLLAVELPGEGGAMEYQPSEAKVRPSGPLGALEVDLFFGVVSVDIYAGILKTLGVGGYVDPVAFDLNSPAYNEEHFTCFTFFYDWRRDNVENAIAFGRYLEGLRGQVMDDGANYVARLRAKGDATSLDEAYRVEEWLATDWKFDVVAHSMGGLLARYYLRYGVQDLPKDGSDPEVTWAGTKEIDRLVMVGTPNLGSLDAFQRLTEGYQLAFFLPNYHQAVLGTMPSIYQLLPRTQNKVVRGADGNKMAMDLFDPEVWAKNQWGLLDPDSDEYLQWLLPDVAERDQRQARAKDYVSWCLSRASAFHRSLDKDAEAPCPIDVRLFAGDTLPTQATVTMVERDGRWAPRFGDADSYLPGDQVVPRYSAIADRRQGGVMDTWLDSPVPWNSVTFLPDEHVGLTTNPLFTDNLLFQLLEQKPRRRQ